MNATHPRRWLQFSLRTLFVAMLLVAAFFGGRESMRPAIRDERSKALQAQAMAEKERLQALMLFEQAESARIVAIKEMVEARARLVDLRDHQQEKEVTPETRSNSLDSP